MQLFKYIESPSSALGESPWLADNGEEIGGPGAWIAFAATQFWAIIVGIFAGLQFGTPTGILAGLAIGICCDIKWRAFSSFLAPAGSIIAGTISAGAFWYLSQTIAGYSFAVPALMVGWVAAGFMNVRYGNWFFGNPSVGHGTGSLLNFIIGPFYFPMWAAFFTLIMVIEGISAVCRRFSGKRSK